MRPSYRFAAVIGVVVLIVSAIGILSLSVSPAEKPPPPPPLEVEKIPGAGKASPPSEQTIKDTLDRVEAAEIERFGEAEAARRRRSREQLIEDRLHPEPH